MNEWIIQRINSGIKRKKNPIENIVDLKVESLMDLNIFSKI